MKKIKDERLALKNLNNIRIAYIIQTIGILGILGYDFVTKGIDGMTENPLWFVFILTTIISAYLSMSISIDYEASEKSPKKSFINSLVVLLLISIVVGILVVLTDGFSTVNGIMIGAILFICGLFPIIYIYYLRRRDK
ncbi:hypothetical protein [Oceanobacillus sp. Castelsardo]|uniref:hypothetical protein n=1 Tax=Oceanobacillus sp. Castelsardo TaxID=1851204 RepID=UPI000837B543|nr:hypothetical protein [Oceanobacillus sp. Castelsardo]